MSDKSAYPVVASKLPDVETDRLILRRFKPSDAPALRLVFAKPEVWMYPYGRGFSHIESDAFLEAQITEWELGGFGCWLAIEKSSAKVIGFVGISVPHFLPEILPAVEVGWRLDPDVWGRGYAIEGATAALNHSFSTLGLEAVCSAPQTINPPSSKVCQRLGMQLERVVTAKATKTRGPVDIDLYWITKSQWNNRSR